MPLPRLPPPVSWPGVPVTAPSTGRGGRAGERAERGVGREPERACPATYLLGHQTLAGDSRLLPAHTSAAVLAHATPSKITWPRAQAPSAGGTRLPWRKGQSAPQGERRDTHPAEREPRRRQESPEGESPGAELPWRRRARRELTSGGEGGLRRPRGSPAQLGPAGGEPLPERNREGG